jgi:hypothetical protein
MPVDTLCRFPAWGTKGHSKPPWRASSRNCRASNLDKGTRTPASADAFRKPRPLRRASRHDAMRTPPSFRAQTVRPRGVPLVSKRTLSQTFLCRAPRVRESMAVERKFLNGAAFHVEKVRTGGTMAREVINGQEWRSSKIDARIVGEHWNVLCALLSITSRMECYADSQKRQRRRYYRLFAGRLAFSWHTGKIAIQVLASPPWKDA